jgi:penicillin-binding protein 1A
LQVIISNGPLTDTVKSSRDAPDAESRPGPGTAPNHRRPWIRVLLGLVLAGACLSPARAAEIDFGPIRDYRPPLRSTILADDGQVIAYIYRENRRLAPIGAIPLQLQNAFIASEDVSFRRHRGVSYRAIIRAMVANLQAGRVIQGGSTITQQLVKLLLLSPRRTFARKLREVRLAYTVEKKFGKDHILWVYLNHVYLGHGAYGVATAAENYFRKPLKKLNLAEMALLAGMTRSPGNDSPPDCLAKRVGRCQRRRGCDPHNRKWLDQTRRVCARRARRRQLVVLNRMLKAGFITAAEHRRAKATVITIWPRRNRFLTGAPYFAEYVRRYLIKKYGRDKVETGGLTVYTTVNLALTRAARRAIDLGLRAYDQRHGFRGPIPAATVAGLDKTVADTDKLPPDQLRLARVQAYDPKHKTFTVRVGKVRVAIALKNWRWARRMDRDFAPESYRQWRKKSAAILKKGDLVLVRLMKKDKHGLWQGHLSQPLTRKPKPEIHAALVSLRTGTGQIKVMIGGRSWRVTQLNRAAHPRSVRQPGSSFKPFVYATALTQGLGPTSTVVDEPVSYRHRGGSEVWAPKNYDHKFLGPITVRTALQKSRNVPAVKILNMVGPDKVIALARKFGLTTPLVKDLSLALGTAEVRLFELTRAYSVFANNGQLIEPVFVLKVVDRHGRVLEQNRPRIVRTVLDPEVNYLMISLLRGVVTGGTATRARVLKQFVCGKTGTTDNHVDAWFMGFTPRLVTGVWVGHDDPKNRLGPGETGAKTALPIWLDYMTVAVGTDPVETFPVPPGIVVRGGEVHRQGAKVVADVEARLAKKKGGGYYQFIMMDME